MMMLSFRYRSLPPLPLPLPLPLLSLFLAMTAAAAAAAGKEAAPGLRQFAAATASDAVDRDGGGRRVFRRSLRRFLDGGGGGEDDYYGFFALLSESCRDATVELYGRNGGSNPTLVAAYEAYMGAERDAFRRSCLFDVDVDLDDASDNLLLDGCDVVIGDRNVVGNFQMACSNSPGGVFHGFTAPAGIECCGYVVRDTQGVTNRYAYAITGYTTRDSFWCAPIACADSNDLRQFYPQGTFQAATKHFEEELGLRCGAGNCEWPPNTNNNCTEETQKLLPPPPQGEGGGGGGGGGGGATEQQLALLNAKVEYYSAIAAAIVESCPAAAVVEDPRGNHYNSNNGAGTPNNFIIDASGVDAECLVRAAEARVELSGVEHYAAACEDSGAALTSSPIVEYGCPTTETPTAGGPTRVILGGTLSCVSSACVLDWNGEETLAVVAKDTELSPLTALATAANSGSACGRGGGGGGSSDAEAGQCHGYVTDFVGYEPNAAPRPIPCDDGDRYRYDNSKFFQGLSCCSASGRDVLKRASIGGFDPDFDGRVPDRACALHTEALQMTLCDPRQGYYVRGGGDNALRICRSSCDAVFDACGMPGVNFPSHASYADGTSLCYDMFGGFGYASPCDSWLDGYPCQSGLSIVVVDDDCLSIAQTVSLFDENGNVPDPCNDPIPTPIPSNSGNNTGATVGIAVGAALGVIACCLFLFCCLTRRWTRGERDGPIAAKNSEASSNYPHGKMDNDEEETTRREDTTTNEDDYANLSTKFPPPVNPSFNAHATPASNISPAGKLLVKPEKLFPSTPPPAFSALVGVVAQESSFSQPQAVRQWMRDHPLEAASLTPSDVGAVLSEVTFSLQQGAVAKEIATGIGCSGGIPGGALTCEHVAAAIRASSSLQKEEVANCMAPYVNDPQNKDIVQNEMGHTVHSF